MKKQILFMMFLSLAFVFAGITNVWAQSDPYLAPTPLQCIDLTDGLRPVPGQPYVYDIEVPVPDGTKTYRWFVTTDESFMAGSEITATPETAGASEYLQWAADHYNESIIEGNAEDIEGDSITLIWNSFTLDASADPGEYLFVVVYVVNEDDDGCITDNLKVYRILPTHAFTLDIANIDPGTDSIFVSTDETPNLEICVDEVQSAIFDPEYGDNGGVVYDFGQNTFYWAVSAANFTYGYELYAQFSGLQGPTSDGDIGQEATLYWSTTFGGEDESITFTWSDQPDTLKLGKIDGSASQEGQMLYIKVVIDHNHFEAAVAAALPYELSIDGVLYGSDGSLLDADEFGDLHHGAAGDTECAVDGFGNDYDTQYLTPRPTVNAEDPQPFLPIAPEEEETTEP